MASDNNTLRKDLGAVSAYAVAVEHGFDGTEAEWEEYIANASNNAAAANTSKLAAEGYAVGKQNGVDVPASSPYFENNSKYYMEQAKASVPADYTELIGDVEDLKSAMTNRMVSDEIKTALLACIQAVAWATDNGRELYDALSFALNPPANLTSISAVFTQTGTIYTTDNLSVLRPGLTVTAHYSDGTEAVVHAYILSGALTEGTSTVTVTYGGKTTTFSVTVTDATLLYNLPESAVFDGSNSSLIDTNVILFPEDRDLTIVIDMQSDTPHNNDWICWCGTAASPYRGLSVRYRNNSYGTGYTVLTAGEAPVPSSYRDGVRNKFVVRKRNGSVAQIMCYNSDAGLSSANASANNVVAPSSKLWIGGVDGNNSSFEPYNFKGTIYDFKVYTRYFEDEEAYAYLDAGVSA